VVALFTENNFFCKKFSVRVKFSVPKTNKNILGSLGSFRYLVPTSAWITVAAADTNLNSTHS